MREFPHSCFDFEITEIVGEQTDVIGSAKFGYFNSKHGKITPKFRPCSNVGYLTARLKFYLPREWRYRIDFISLIEFTSCILKNN